MAAMVSSNCFGRWRSRVVQSSKSLAVLKRRRLGNWAARRWRSFIWLTGIFKFSKRAPSNSCSKAQIIRARSGDMARTYSQ